MSAVSAVIGAITYIRFGVLDGGGNSILLAAVVGVLAAIPALAFTHIWRSGEELETRKSLVLLGTAYGLFLAGLFIAAPAWAAPVMGLIASVSLLALYARRDSAALTIMAWVSAATAWLALGVTPDHAAELTQLGPVPQAVDMLRALVRWMSVATIFLGLAWLGRSALSRGVGEAGGVILIYGAIAQAVPSMPLAWIAAAGAIALYLWNAGRKAAWGTALTIAGLWSFVPFAQWLDAGVGSVIGDPFLVISAVTPKDLALKFAPVALAIAVILRRGAGVGVQAKAAFAIALGVIAVVAGHSLFKLLFAVGSPSVFVEYGMAERSAWQWLLLICALGAARLFPSPKRAWIALGLVGAGLMHFVWFTAILHNPLWAEQAVGAVPIANWLTPAYLAAIAGLWLASAQMRHIEMAGAQIKDVELDEAERALSSARLDLAPRVARLVCDVATMVLIAAWSFSLLRQVFAGSILTAVPIGPSESLVISLLGIVLALGFLAWGSVKRTRSWRIGSLVLMLVAVAKVFLIDAAGLDGLLRIASFMALGFSLIGIGWFYSKQLTRDRTAEMGAEMSTDADAEVSSATQRAQ
ncbi:MAG: DUF2339 domain-containing protein [Rhodobacteraceae bacterium]|nr:DUF2339 domain-containing protein [Paracoccaceae bacterium]